MELFRLHGGFDSISSRTVNGAVTVRATAPFVNSSFKLRLLANSVAPGGGGTINAPSSNLDSTAVAINNLHTLTVVSIGYEYSGSTVLGSRGGFYLIFSRRIDHTQLTSADFSFRSSYGTVSFNRSWSGGYQLGPGRYRYTIWVNHPTNTIGTYTVYFKG